MNPAPGLTPTAARAIARAAYTYAFPLVEGYKTLYKQALDAAGPEFRAPLNQIGHAAGVATPADTQFVTPNTDTPYSFLWADARAEPIVITMPRIEPGRYYSAQLIDLYTHNFAFLGTRAFGNDGGAFLIAGPAWKGASEGEMPAGIRAVIRCETELFYALFRVQLFNAADLPNAQAVQQGFRAEPLSQFLGQDAPAAAPPVDWPTLVEGMTETADLFRYLNFLLRFAPPHPSEQALLAEFARLGIAAGQPFDAAALSPDIAQAVTDGIADVWREDFAGLMARVNAGELTSADVFGTREFLGNNYLYRLLGAKVGIYGLSREEAIYPVYFIDGDGRPLDAATGRYTLRFAPGDLPPADAFWSLTMYDGRTQLLVANRLERYLLNSTMLDAFAYDPDGSLTLTVARDLADGEPEANWLPAPDGPFYMAMRLYLPRPEALDGRWRPPALQRM